MTIALLATDEQFKEINFNATTINWQRIPSLSVNFSEAAALIIISEVSIEDLKKIKIPVLLNAVSTTLTELNTGENIIRINGWPGFLKRPNWEVAGVITAVVKDIFAALNISFCKVADEPGFVSARTIAMIINEAYFALGENVSTKKEIDIAMKLGTNYPFGPFEWATIIGVKNIFKLLTKLSQTDKSYLPAPLLQTEAALCV